MADKLIRNFSTTATSPAADDYLALDGATNNTRRILADKFATTTDALLAANDLSDVASAATSRTNLSVNSIDEDAEATGTKLVSPSLYFDGTNDFLEVDDSDKLTFSTLTEFGKATSGTWAAATNTPALTDGTGTLNDHYKIDADGTVAQGASTLSVINGVAATAGQVVYYDGSVWRIKDADDLPFSISGWVKMTDATNFTVLGKYGAGGSQEWLFYTTGSGKLSIWFRDTSSNTVLITQDASMTPYLDQMIHLAVSYSGAGPNSSNAFASAGNGVSVYINGVDVTSDFTVTNNASYVGMSNTAQSVRIGVYGAGAYGNGHIKEVKLFNRELSAAEVVDSMNSDLGFADEWGAGFGGLGTIDETVGKSSWTGTGAITYDNITETANTTVGARPNVLKLEATATAGETRWYASATSIGKRARVEFDYYIDSANTTIDQIQLKHTSGTTIATLTVTDAWTRASVEYVNDGTSVVFQFRLLDGGATGATAGDYVGLDNFSTTEIGTLADFRASNFDSDTSKIYDISDNAFVGTSANPPSIVGRSLPVYTTGTWTPALEFGSASVGMTFSLQEGFYTRIGNTVHIQGVFTLSAKGSSTGLARITGCPFSSRNVTGNNMPATLGVYSGMSGLTSPISASFEDSAANIRLYDIGPAGVVVLDEGNFTDTTNLSFSATYQIQ